ncbi:MAG: DUF2946 domain-containing protein [Bacillota bacterium]
MGIKLRIRYVAAWITCFSILLAALAPTIFHALSAARERHSYPADICSMSGPVADGMATRAAHHSPAPAQNGAAFEHCPFCLTHAGSFGLPPLSPSPLAVTRQAFLLPALFAQSPRPLFVWATPHSRAPPAFS